MNNQKGSLHDGHDTDVGSANPGESGIFMFNIPAHAGRQRCEVSQKRSHFCFVTLQCVMCDKKIIDKKIKHNLHSSIDVFTAVGVGRKGRDEEGRKRNIFLLCWEVQEFKAGLGLKGRSLDFK